MIVDNGDEKRRKDETFKMISYMSTSLIVEHITERTDTANHIDGLLVILHHFMRVSYADNKRLNYTLDMHTGAKASDRRTYGTHCCSRPISAAQTVDVDYYIFLSHIIVVNMNIFMKGCLSFAPTRTLTFISIEGFECVQKKEH